MDYKVALQSLGSKMEEPGVDQQNQSELPERVVLRYSLEDQAKGGRRVQRAWHPTKSTGIDVWHGGQRGEHPSRRWQPGTGGGEKY